MPGRFPPVPCPNTQSRSGPRSCGRENTMCMAVPPVLIVVDVIKAAPPDGAGRRPLPSRWKNTPGAAPQHAFVRSHPLNAQAVRNGEHLFRGRCLPTATRPSAVSQKTCWCRSSARHQFVRVRLRDVESGSAAKASPATRPNPRWCHIPVEEWDDKRESPKSRSIPSLRRLRMPAKPCPAVPFRRLITKALIFERIVSVPSESGPATSLSSRKNSSNHAICERTCKSVKCCGSKYFSAF